MRIVVDNIVYECADAHIVESATIGNGRRLVVVVRNHHRTYGETTLHKFGAKTEHIFIIGNTQVGTYLVSLNIFGTDDNNYFKSVAELREHFQLGVGFKARKDTASVVVVEEFSTQFKIQLAVELRNTFTNVFRLNAAIFVVVKSNVHN